MNLPVTEQQLQEQVALHLERLYPQADIERLTGQVIAAMGLPSARVDVSADALWDERDCLLITYGDSIRREGQAPLQTLRHFYRERLQDVISSVHILPFYPFSSDDGFSVINYAEVNQSLGDWADIRDLAGDAKLMFDVVINHCSSRSLWFENFRQQKTPGKDYFVEADPAADLSAVVRPRTSPLLRPVDTLSGERHVWCTFSHDQVDLNFQNPEVLLEMLRVMALYLDQGARLFRLDAIAFVWKIIGTPCINLDETHEFVRLLRALVSYRDPRVLLITETNIPHLENLSYFGNGNEAHVVYNFALPPLILHTLWSGDSSALNVWLMSMPAARENTCYLNFIASHDGIGLRPVEGLLEPEAIQRLLQTCEARGGRVSWRTSPNGGRSAYEMNIALFDALSGTHEGADGLVEDRFICAHSIMLALQGMPALYIHSLLATGNDTERMERSGHNRCINRHQWDESRLLEQLDSDTPHRRVLQRLKKLLKLRGQSSAFHPNAAQTVLHLSEGLLGFWRQCTDAQQDVYVISNITDGELSLDMMDLNLEPEVRLADLISGDPVPDAGEPLLLRPYRTLWLSRVVA